MSRLNSPFYNHKKAQDAAKEVLRRLSSFISSQESERTIADFAVGMLKDYGIHKTWYYETPALVLLGSRSCTSISGKDYKPPDELVGNENLVTVDLSPMVDGCWGDCARSYAVEYGEVTEQPSNQEIANGLRFVRELHTLMKEFVKPSTTFAQLYEFGNMHIERNRYENLDFLKNLGHSIEQNLKDRRFIDRTCDEPLDSATFFTFEPHIRKVQGKWGFKHENIYYFSEAKQLREL